MALVAALVLGLVACGRESTPRTPRPVVVAPVPPQTIHAEASPSASPSSLSCEEIEAYIAEVERLVPKLAVRRHVQGEDATSGFINEVRERGSTVLRVRTAWNGGCCNPAEITDLYLRDGVVVAVVDSTANAVDGDAVLHGNDPKTRKITQRKLFCGPRVDAREHEVAEQTVRELIDDITQPRD